MRWPPRSRADVLSLSSIAPWLTVPARKLLTSAHGHLTHPAVYAMPRAVVQTALRHNDRTRRQRAQAEISAAITAWGPVQ